MLDFFDFNFDVKVIMLSYSACLSTKNNNKMKLYTPNNHSKKVAISDIISEPSFLKMLVLHTPVPMDLTGLSACVSLIKLDLSNSNLVSLPFLGSLPFLKIFYLHDNRLTP